MSFRRVAMPSPPLRFSLCKRQGNLTLNAIVARLLRDRTPTETRLLGNCNLLRLREGERVGVKWQPAMYVKIGRGGNAPSYESTLLFFVSFSLSVRYFCLRNYLGKQAL